MGNVHQGAVQDVAGLPCRETVLLLLAPPIRLDGCIVEVHLPSANLMMRPQQGRKVNVSIAPASCSCSLAQLDPQTITRSLTFQCYTSTSYFSISYIKLSNWY